MEKISVKVCLGTTCFVMGGSNLQELNDIIPKKYGDKVEVIGSPCLGLCSINWEYSKAPYVKIDLTKWHKLEAFASALRLSISE